MGRSSASSGEIPEQTAASVNPRRRNSDTKQGEDLELQCAYLLLDITTQQHFCTGHQSKPALHLRLAQVLLSTSRRMTIFCHVAQRLAGTRVRGRRAGQWLADGRRGILVASCGDLDYMSQFQGLPRWNSNSFCCLRQCQKRGAHSWHDFSEGAQWRTTAWSTAAWRNWPNRSMNKLFQKDLCSVLVVHFDLMRCRLSWLPSAAVRKCFLATL